MSIYINGKLVAGGSQTLPLLSFMWSDHQLNHPSWLRADTFSWQSGAVYTAAYAHLVLDIDGKTLQSETISGTTIQFYLADDGHKICPASEESNVTAIYNATGVAWYYILDTANQRFKLPRKSAEFLAKADYIDYAHPIEMTNGGTSSVYGWFYISGHSYSGQETVSLNGQVVYWGGNAGTERLSGDCILWVKPGDVISWATWNGQVAMSRIYPAVKSGISAPNEKYLYFYVGNFTQTALENTAGLNAELFNNKVDKGHQVIEFQAPTAENGYTWYRKYADGWVEQGGQFTNSARSTTISLPITMANTDYYVSVMLLHCEANWIATVNAGVQNNTRTTTSFVAQVWFENNQTTGLNCWQVSGISA